LDWIQKQLWRSRGIPLHPRGLEFSYTLPIVSQLAQAFDGNMTFVILAILAFLFPSTNQPSALPTSPNETKSKLYLLGNLPVTERVVTLNVFHYRVTHLNTHTKCQSLNPYISTIVVDFS
jgi:hypothetical protein